MSLWTYDAGAWRSEPDSFVDGDTFSLPGLTSDMTVDDVYDDILDARGMSLLR